MIYGYARCSTSSQDLTIQVEALEAAGCSIIRKEKVSGKSRTGREELATLLEFLRKGDELVITRIDRLARSVRDLQNIVHELEQKGASLRSTEQPIDTSSASGKCFFDMLSVFSSFETNLRHERQMEGVAKAKAAGKYKGRPKSLDTDAVMTFHAEGLGATAIARQMGISRQSVYRTIKQAT